MILGHDDHDISEERARKGNLELDHGAEIERLAREKALSTIMKNNTAIATNGPAAFVNHVVSAPAYGGLLDPGRNHGGRSTSGESHQTLC